eukprot:gnl/TRDRNA2_/TRDRNA2_134751_c0_seq1.p1 gnl/TRDRNA2_/TRDRNA2_134751_c0~~gnl/TRDRNA2_/TRDRNA2_134751_c0_seq1.p1  ORF type:complete len:252 (-),score=26.61 gnl/TRDRNA2_/TRDRNA2_134751_c0_seq1:69-824(-)
MARSAVVLCDLRCSRSSQTRSVSRSAGGGYKRASLKYPYAMVHLVRELKRAGRPLPQWWLLMETDTFVGSVDLVMAQTQGVDPLTEAVMFAQFAGSAMGGGGILFSSFLAEKLSIVFGERMLQYMIDHIKDGSFYWDEHTVSFVKYWVRGGRVIDGWLLQAFSPHQDVCLKPNMGPERIYPGMPYCNVIPDVCMCARHETPATWHFLNNPRPWEESIRVLESFYNRTLQSGPVSVAGKVTPTLDADGKWQA